jgi:PIN domain nuclease of toxin-antitoxin system
MVQALLLDTASGWEIATKVRLGKLPGAEGLLQVSPSLLHQQGFQPLAVQLHHGVHAGLSTDIENCTTSDTEK